MEADPPSAATVLAMLVKNIGARWGAWDAARADTWPRAREAPRVRTSTPARRLNTIDE